MLFGLEIDLDVVMEKFVLEFGLEIICNMIYILVVIKEVMCL